MTKLSELRSVVFKDLELVHTPALTIPFTSASTLTLPFSSAGCVLIRINPACRVTWLPSVACTRTSSTSMDRQRPTASFSLERIYPQAMAPAPNRSWSSLTITSSLTRKNSLRPLLSWLLSSSVFSVSGMARPLAIASGWPAAMCCAHCRIKPTGRRVAEEVNGSSNARESSNEAYGYFMENFFRQ